MNTILKVSTAIALAVVATSGSIPAHAQGALDFMDKCIKARRDFAEQRQAYFAKFDLTENSVDSTPHLNSKKPG